MHKKGHKYLKGGQVKLDKNKVPKGYHRMPDGSLMKDKDMKKKYGHGGKLKSRTIGGGRKQHN